MRFNKKEIKNYEAHKTLYSGHAIRILSAD